MHSPFPSLLLPGDFCYLRLSLQDLHPVGILGTSFAVVMTPFKLSLLDFLQEPPTTYPLHSGIL